MKRFSKLLAVVLAIAVIICPMTIFAETSTPSGGYKIEAIDENNLKLTISSTDGFLAYDATVSFDEASDFQSNYTDANTGYTDGLKVITYTLKTAQPNPNNAPKISANTTSGGSALKVIVMSNAFTNTDVYTSIVIGIRVASGATATLTKIQAADNGTVDSADANLLTFPAANESTGVIDQNAQYATENATTVHTHDLTPVSAKDATCTEPGNTAYYTCSCGKIFSDSEGTDETTLEAVTIPATGHTVVNDAAVAPTCTATGLTAGSHCSVCNAVIVAQETVPATGHTPVTDEAVAPTCTATGLTAGSHCSVCGAIITAQEEVSANGHTPVTDEAVAATCTATGLTAGSHCSVCDTVLVAQTVVPALGHAYTYHENGNGTHTVGCGRCDYSAQEDCDTDGTDGACSKCGYKAQAVCTHNYVGVVTTQPTKTSTGVMTYTCTECGDSYTEDIAIPAVISTKMLNPSLYFASSVGMKLAVNTNALSSLGYSSTYTIVCNYQEYATGYVLQDAQTVFPSSAYDNVAKGFIFTSLPLTQMCEEVEFTIYCQNANGVVTGYYTVNSSIISLALSYASKYSSDVKLLRTLADMVNYGDAAQQYFAAQNPGTAIALAESPITLFGDYVLNASSVEDDMPESFTTTKQETKNLTTTGLAVSPTMLIGASNSPKFTIKVPYSYDLSKLTVSISYTDSYNAEQSVNVSGTDLTFVSDNTAKQFKTYSIVFDKLALCDLQKVLTVQIYNEEVLEYTYNYSLGAYINQYIGYEQLRPLLTHAVLFANSAYDKLIVG